MTRLKYKISPWIFQAHSSQWDFFRDPDLVQVVSLLHSKQCLSLSHKINSKFLSLICEALTISTKTFFPFFISNTRWTLPFGHTELCSIFQRYFPLCFKFCLCYFFSKGYNLSSFLIQLISYLDLAWNATMDLEVWGDVWEFGKHITWRNFEFLNSCISGWQQGFIF